MSSPEATSPGRRLPPWAWIPTLYFAESIPNAVVSDTAKFMYTDFGVSTAQLGLITGSMYWAWVVKPMWSPLVDLIKTKRWWIVLTELLLAGSFLGLAMAIQSPQWLLWTQICLWAMALASATQDIAADGFYMLGLSEQEQAGYSGVRSTAYRLAMLCAKGVLVYIAGHLTRSMGLHEGWSAMMCIPGALFVVMGLYHLVVLPRPGSDVPRQGMSASQFFANYVATFGSFFNKPRIVPALAFMLLFRLAEVQVLAMVAPFLKGKLEVGGLAMTTEQVGLAYGTFGVVGIICGGVTAGAIVARQGLRRWFWTLIIGMHIPNLAFLYLAFSQNNHLPVVSLVLFLEQFGYGFGFTVYILYLMYFSKGELQTSHYAIATGFMAMSLMLPQMVSGYAQTALGFKGFFAYVAVCTLPSFAVAWMAWKDVDFLDYFEPKMAAVESDEIGISPS